MGQLGMGVMLNMLGGNEDSVIAYTGALNKIIKDVRLDQDDNSLRFVFNDESKIKLFDNGQSCCESRYMHTDDDLAYHIGAQLLKAEIKEAPDQPDEYGDVHEVEFLVITTSKGVFTMSNHNEHNGYYGGFSVCAAVDQ